MYENKEGCVLAIILVHFINIARTCNFSRLFFFFHESESVFQLLVFRKFLEAFVNIQKISRCHQKFFIVFEHFGQLSELL